MTYYYFFYDKNTVQRNYYAIGSVMSFLISTILIGISGYNVSPAYFQMNYLSDLYFSINSFYRILLMIGFFTYGLGHVLALLTISQYYFPKQFVFVFLAMMMIIGTFMLSIFPKTQNQYSAHAIGSFLLFLGIAIAEIIFGSFLIRLKNRKIRLIGMYFILVLLFFIVFLALNYNLSDYRFFFQKIYIFNFFAIYPIILQTIIEMNYPSQLQSKKPLIDWYILGHFIYGLLLGYISYSFHLFWIGILILFPLEFLFHQILRGYFHLWHPHALMDHAIALFGFIIIYYAMLGI